jgi:hypothetical protein
MRYQQSDSGIAGQRGSVYAAQTGERPAKETRRAKFGISSRKP